MGFTRKWDESCPRVWDKWEQDGVNWVIQDLAPEDDETALKILEKDFLPDEALCCWSKVLDDPESLRSVLQFWRDNLALRMSLGCYTVVNGEKTLVGLNVCVANTADEKGSSTPIEGVAWTNVYGAFKYLLTKCSPHKYLDLNLLLHALGLSVKKEYRGYRLGSRILAARKPLCQAHGIKATATMFTGIASQKSAERCGFEPICAVDAKELAEHGLNYPSDDSIVIKLMVKRYDND